jgi:RNA polymerase sigma factor (sigma-70 family)
MQREDAPIVAEMAARYTSPDEPSGVYNDEAAHLQLLITDHHAPLYSFLCVLLRDREAAEDALQETYARAYVHLSRNREVTRAWLYRVARNLAVDELRRRTRIDRSSGTLDSSLQEPVARVIDQTVHRALDELSPDDREILYLADVDNFSAAEIGAMLGIRAGAVRTRLCRAHQRFRAVYEVDR